MPSVYNDLRFTQIIPDDFYEGRYKAIFVHFDVLARTGPPEWSEMFSRDVGDLCVWLRRQEFRQPDEAMNQFDLASKAFAQYLSDHGISYDNDAPIKSKLASDFIEFSEIRRVRKDSNKLVAVFNVLQPRGPYALHPDGRDTKTKTYFKVENLEVDADWWEKDGHFIPDELEKAIKAAEAFELK